MTPRYAGFWIRFVADLIDSTLLTVLSSLIELMILGVYYWITVLFLRHGGEPIQFVDAFNPLMIQFLNLVLYVGIAIPYYVIGHFRFGTTLGKRPFRVYVVQVEGLGPITYRQSMIRCFSYVVSYLPFLTGYIMAAFHPEKRALHDLIAGTVSIRRSSVQLD